MKIGGYPVYRIQWIDACSSSEWASPSDLVSEPVDMDTIAIVVKRGKRAITVTHTISAEGLAGDPFRIPKSAITAMKRLR